MSQESEYIIKQSLLSTKLSKKIEKQLSIHGLSFTEYLIMHYLKQNMKSTMRRVDLADAIGLSPSGITRVIAPMEKLKILEKEINPRDARQSLVKLSSAGETLYLDAKVGFEASSSDLLNSLSSRQIDKSLEQINKLL